jgi:ketosteroid isomerase-like protein
VTSPNMQTLETLLGGGNAELNKNRTSGAFEQWLREFYDPDIEVHEPPSLPYGGVHRGVDNWLNARKIMMATWEQKLDILNIYEDAEKNVIILNYLMDWTAKSTGRNFRMPAIEVLTFRDAKIAKLEFYPQDAKAMADSLEPTAADG